jgi:uncharacterized protein YjbJ (UPF0337 family)
MSKENIKGKFNEAKGDIKQAVGRATDNPSLINEGTADKVKGKAQQVVGHAKDAVRDITR